MQDSAGESGAPNFPSVHFFPSRFALSCNAHSPSISVFRKFEIRQAMSEKWTLSTFLTLPEKEKSGHFGLRKFSHVPTRNAQRTISRKEENDSLLSKSFVVRCALPLGMFQNFSMSEKRTKPVAVPVPPFES